MAAIEKFDLRFVSQPELRVQPSHFGILVGHPVVSSDAIVMSSLHHEWPRNHQVRHLRIIERVAHIEIGHLPLDAVHKAESLVRARDLFGPAIEIAGADREAVTFQNRWNTHGGLATVAEAIESNPARV